MSELRQDPPDTISSREHDPQALSEAQLRQLYDEEEVERFISLFSAYVTEARFSTGTVSTDSTDSRIVDSLDTTTRRRTSTPPHLPRRPTDRSLSENIAYNYLLPHLPPATNVTPTFTLKRLSLTTQRLYLALFPPYQAFLSNLVQLALWEDYQRSLRYCIVFWFLWFHDLLLPALIFRIVFGLLRRRLSTFPTLEELQERRQDTARALKFGEAVQQRLSVTTLGPIEVWRLFKLYKSDEKVTSVQSAETDEENFKRGVLHALNDLTDFHERVKNIFTWRRPDVSRRYLLVLVVVGLGTLVVPAQYIAKLVYWFGGVVFWHVVPVLAALPRADRIRVSHLFRDAPTDADYAMELIAKRIATGQDVDTASLRNQSRRASSTSASAESLSLTICGTSHEVQSSEDDGINWKKWGKRVARGKLLVEEGRRFLSPQTSRNHVSGDTAAIHRPGTEDAYTFLAQYASFPGLITLTSSTLFFTSLAGTRARLIVPRARLRGVKKSGLMRGISITWVPEESVDGEEREEKFHWVGDRDELFARLVGSDAGGHWITV